jgi:hypothetical protein
VCFVAIPDGRESGRTPHERESRHVGQLIGEASTASQPVDYNPFGFGCPHIQARIVMAESEKDRIARQVADLRITFDTALSNKRKYPVAEFKAFVQSARR